MSAEAAQADCLVDGSTIFNIKNIISKEEQVYLKVGQEINEDYEKTEQLKRLIIYGFYKNIEISKYKASNFFGRTEVTDLLSIKYTESDSNETLIMLCNFILNIYPVEGFWATTANRMVKKDVNILIRLLIFFLYLLSIDNPLSEQSPPPPLVKRPAPPPAPSPHLYRESSSNLGGSKSYTSGGAALDTHSESLSELFKTMASKTSEIDVQKLFNDFKTNEYHKIKKKMLDDINFGGTNLPCKDGVKQLFFGRKNILLTYDSGGVIKNKRKRRKSKRKGQRKSKKKGRRKSKKKGQRKSKRKGRRRLRRTKK